MILAVDSNKADEMLRASRPFDGYIIGEVGTQNSIAFYVDFIQQIGATSEYKGFF